MFLGSVDYDRWPWFRPRLELSDHGGDVAYLALDGKRSVGRGR